MMFVKVVISKVHVIKLWHVESSKHLMKFVRLMQYLMGYHKLDSLEVSYDKNYAQKLRKGAKA